MEIFLIDFNFVVDHGMRERNIVFIIYFCNQVRIFCFFHHTVLNLGKLINSNLVAEYVWKERKNVELREIGSFGDLPEAERCEP